MEQEDIIRETIRRAEDIRYKCLGSSTTASCMMYITSSNEVMMLHENRAIFRTYIPEYYELHPEIAYNRTLMRYNEDKSIDLSDLSVLNLGDLNTIHYCRAKYYEYISEDTLATKSIVIHQQDLSTNDSFIEVSGIKSGDGLRYFYVSENNITIRIPYFVGLYSIKKADKYGITVYDFDRFHFLVKITDKKPKLNNIDIFMVILKGI
jgi:hypothetical protein